MSLEAYRKVQTSTDTPTQSEYRLFAQVTSALVRARDEGHGGAKLMESLDWNRRLWSTLAADCGAPGNKLPNELRAQIISLSLFVAKHTSQVFRKNSDIDTLIEINQAVMAGLEAQMNAVRKAQAGNAQTSQTYPQQTKGGVASQGQSTHTGSPQPRPLGLGLNA